MKSFPPVSVAGIPGSGFRGQSLDGQWSACHRHTGPTVSGRRSSAGGHVCLALLFNVKFDVIIGRYASQGFTFIG